MQMLRKMNPLFLQGLTWKQRISYFSSVIVYLDGIQRLVFYLAPVLFFLFGVLPVKVANHELLVRLVPYMVLTIVSFELLSRGTGYILISERYNMTRFWTYILATSGYFARKPLKFNVTPKGAGDVPFETYAPQFILAGSRWSRSCGRSWRGTRVDRLQRWRRRLRGVHGERRLGGVEPLLRRCTWCGTASRRKQLRADYRFAQRLPTRCAPWWTVRRR